MREGTMEARERRTGVASGKRTPCSKPVACALSQAAHERSHASEDLDGA